jgi:ribonuclease G
MKKILINDNQWQTRIAITRDDNLENVYFKTQTRPTLERSYFKGGVSKVLPGIQTAFVNIGQEKAGFLHISEIDRELAIKRMGDQLEDLEEIDAFDESDVIKPQDTSRSSFDISKILKEGEAILVQVSKEPVYEKGAKLTTCFTIPGRFLVLMPNIPRIGISKKIEEREERQRLREIVSKNLPEGMGAIIRTSSEHKVERDICQDLNYLVSTWNEILKRYQAASVAEKIHEDIDLVLQVIRDSLDDDVEVILCDTIDSQNHVYKFIKHIAPEFSSKVRLYEGEQGLFEKYGIEKQIAQALEKKVALRSGGSLIIETTEAMTVIDVNTGRFVGQSNLEDTLLKTNLDAAEEIVRQLRLRNIGGLIVIDFIDMASNNNRQRLYRFLEKTLKEHDKFQSVVLRVSEFGLVQMTRKRSGKTLMQLMTETCQCCKGLGSVKSAQTEAFTVFRKLIEMLKSRKLRKDAITIAVHPVVFDFITTQEYNAILTIEKMYRCKITVITHDHPERNVFNITGD